MEKPIRFSLHALAKFEALKAHGLDVERDLVLNTVRSPRKVVKGYRDRGIAQGTLDDERVLRVVYEETRDEIVVVTFYPGRRERYE